MPRKTKSSRHQSAFSEPLIRYSKEDDAVLLLTHDIPYNTAQLHPGLDLLWDPNEVGVLVGICIHRVSEHVREGRTAFVRIIQEHLKREVDERVSYTKPVTLECYSKAFALTIGHRFPKIEVSHQGPPKFILYEHKTLDDFLIVQPEDEASVHSVVQDLSQYTRCAQYGPILRIRDGSPLDPETVRRIAVQYA